MKFLLRFITLSLPLLTAPAIAHADNPKGNPRIVDGDTIEIGGTKIRLHVIDAPESKQTCQKTDSRKHLCGEMATFALAEIVEEHWITCKGETVNHYKRRIAACYAGPYDINAKMVKRSWALAYRQYSMDYMDEEADARGRGVSMWQGSFV